MFEFPCAMGQRNKKLVRKSEAPVNHSLNNGKLFAYKVIRLICPFNMFVCRKAIPKDDRPEK